MTEYKDLEPSTNPKHNKEFLKNIVIAALAVMLLLAVGYIVYSKEANAKNSNEMQSDINDLERSREILKQELRIIRSDFDDAKTRVVKKDSSLSYQDRLILEKQKEIQSILNKEAITTIELNRAKRLISSLQADIKVYKEEITRLKDENTKLTNKNTELTSENSNLSNEKKTVETNLHQEKESHQNLINETNSTLSISNYTIKGFRVKSNGKEIETSRARRIDKVRVSFDLDKNLNATSENKELYVSIFKPNGDIGKFKGADSGKVKLRSGNSVDYSDRVEVSYNNMSGSRVSFDWVDYEFPKGEYKIDIYQNGYKVGQNVITLD
jgi:FtsZ-binding cell division protein ZapB